MADEKQSGVPGHPLPEARTVPSGLKATDQTALECPLSVARSCPLRASHSLTVLSKLPEARVLPSGLKATDKMAAECPFSEARSCPPCASHSLISPGVPAAPLPEAKGTKGGEKFWLQGGSFSTESDAENLKARLAFAGWEASVQQGFMPDKAVRFRVRLGPYDNQDEMQRIKTDLGKRGFEAAVMKF